MLRSFLNSVVQLFKGPSTTDDSYIDSEDHEKHIDISTFGRDRTSTTETIENGSITNDSAFSDNIETLGNVDSQTSALENDTRHANDVNNDGNCVHDFENSGYSARITDDEVYHSRTPFSCEYRTRAQTVDETQLESLQPTGQNRIKIRYLNPTFYSERLEKCVSMPNLFRATSIQDKSMKISRKRRERKHARLMKGRSPASSSESEKESNEVEKEALSDTRKITSKSARCFNKIGNKDDVFENVSLNACITKSFDSLFDELRNDESSSDSDEYCSCNEDIVDDNDNYSKEYKNKKLNRISSIQERYWSIRQRRRENFHKGKLMDVAINNQS